MELPELFALMEQQDNFVSGGGVSEECVSKFEAALGSELPKPYKAFVRRYGWAWWFGGQILGISADRNLDALECTFKAREEVFSPDWKPLPQHVVVLNRYSGGGLYLLHCHPSTRAGCITLHIDEEMRCEVDVWPTFEAYLMWCLE
jgi:hypothetical protein